MDRLSELEDRVTRLEGSRVTSVTCDDNVSSAVYKFACMSYSVDVDIFVMSTTASKITITLNGVPHVYDGNFVHDTYRVLANNTIEIAIESGGLLSKRIRIEGIGVRLLTQ